MLDRKKKKEYCVFRMEKPLNNPSILFLYFITTSLSTLSKIHAVCQIIIPSVKKNITQKNRQHSTLNTQRIGCSSGNIYKKFS